MLWLKRNAVWNQLMKCDVSNEVIAPGDYYYIDDVDGIRIKATVYKRIKDKQKEDNWDYSKLNSATSQAEYKRMLKEATQRMLAATILDRKVAMKHDPNPGVENETIQDLYDDHKNRHKYNGGADDDRY